MPGANDAGGGIDTGVGSNFTVAVEVDGRMGFVESDERVDFVSKTSPSSSLSQSPTASSRLMTTELPDTPWASRARSLHGSPAIRGDEQAFGCPTLLGPATAFDCLREGA